MTFLKVPYKTANP